MNLILSEEQLIIKSSATKFFMENFSFEKRINYIQSKELKPEEKILNSAVDFGWAALPFKQVYGGLEGNVTDIMCLLEVFGAHLNVDPYIFSLLYPGKVLEEICNEDKKNIYLKKLINGSKISYCFSEPGQRYDHTKVNSRVKVNNNKYYINGKKNFVLASNLSDYILFPTKSDDNLIYLFILEKNNNSLVSNFYKTIDDSYAFDYEFNNLELQDSNLLAAVSYDVFKNKIEYINDFITLACCADALGIIEKMYELTLDYVKTREQFGKKIGSFQVVQHRMVEMYIKKEEMRSLNYMGQLALQENINISDRKKNISLNKIFLGLHAKNIGQECIQLHGGMGVANEMQIGHYFKR